MTNSYPFNSYLNGAAPELPTDTIVVDEDTAEQVDQAIVDAAENAIATLLSVLGVDEGEHTTDTPRRVAKAWREVLWGYHEDPAQHLAKTFPAPTDPGLVIVHGITLRSWCAHHMLPFTGHATVAYRPSPGQRIVGLSKLARVVQGYAARLQVQEQIGTQTVDAITQQLNPSGAIVVITATHDCMRLRGVADAGAATTTEARHGLLTDPELSLVYQSHHRA